MHCELCLALSLKHVSHARRSVSNRPGRISSSRIHADSSQSIVDKTEKLGFIGLGIMGDGMARRLLESGQSLHVWNRSPSKCTQILSDYEDKVIIEESPADVIQKSDIIFVMLSTPQACNEIYNHDKGILSAITPGKCVVDCATLQPDDMIQTSKKVQEKGGIFLEAPVSGSKVPAETGTLVFLAAGSRPLFDRVSPYLSSMGKSSHYLGEVGEGTRMKLVVNSILANMLATLAEGMALAETSGLQPDTLLQVLSEGAMSNPMYAGKGPRMISGDHPPNFPLKHAHKDLLFAVNLAKSLGVEAKVSLAAEALYKKAIDKGHGDLDCAAISLVTK
eukprot:CAMPEP_0182430634 /NCGR_PEP_ID=MMETSP1167-20130531/42137_1 /TAXON_ID=2988 /ORGANISM="Mallomonas Sp, Strain CCMP3275" /LENGTH=333 /DNA_ID=CAMNT_0024615957 /DNA_START=177 /DNA_END=1178 /DNA_ORIENTATION=-